MQNFRKCFTTIKGRRSEACALAGIVLGLLLLSSAARAQHMNVGTNLLYWATTTPNARAEWLLKGHYTLSATFGYNAFNFKDDSGANPKLHHWLVYPEVKYWFCRPFEHDYVGVHAFYGRYNAGGIGLLGFLDDCRWKGYGMGIGISYGYQWAFGKRWGIEASLGIGYAYLNYRKYESGTCGDLLAKVERHLLLPTKLSLSLLYFIR